MKSQTVVNSFLVIIGFLLAFGVGYLLFNKDSSELSQVDDTANQTETTEQNTEDLASMVPDEAMALSRNGCLSCHAVESIEAPGGDIGPDLSRVFPEIKGKHGKELDEFLQEPTSAVMATVIAGKPLEDKEREQIVESLKLASEKWEKDLSTKKKKNDSEDDNGSNDE